MICGCCLLQDVVCKVLMSYIDMVSNGFGGLYWAIIVMSILSESTAFTTIWEPDTFSLCFDLPVIYLVCGSELLEPL